MARLAFVLAIRYFGPAKNIRGYNIIAGLVVIPQKSGMSIVAAFLVIAIPLLLNSCSKEEATSGAEYELYGKWAKGSNPGDTVEYMSKNNQNIMRNMGPLSAGVWTYAEYQYKFANGKLRLKHPSMNDFLPVSSFTWTQRGVAFTITSDEIFPYYSSMPVILTYRKN